MPHQTPTFYYGSGLSGTLDWCLAPVRRPLWRSQDRRGGSKSYLGMHPMFSELSGVRKPSVIGKGDKRPCSIQSTSTHHP